MIKIVNVANIDPSEKCGGLNLMVKNIIRVENECGINSSLIYFNRPRYPNSNLKLSSRFENIFKFIKSIDSSKHYVFHSVYNVKYIGMMLAILIKGAKYSIHAHGSLSNHCIRKSKVKLVFFKPVIEMMLYFSSRVIFSNQSEFNYSFFKNENKVSFIPNLIKRNVSCEIKSRELKKIIFVGKVDYYYKGISVLLRAMSVFITEHPDYILEIYGYGNSKNIRVNSIPQSETDLNQLLRDIDELKLSKNVFFRGPVTGQSKCELFQESGLFVLTSNSEAMPLAISEALSSGLPALVTPETNMAKYIEDYKAGIVSENNANAVYEALCKYEQFVSKEHDVYSKRALILFEHELDECNLSLFINKFLKSI